MFYNQPLALRFGSELVKYIDQKTGIDPYWDTLDIAVAWVRASGMAHVSSQLEQFLKQGGQLSVTVGIDLMSTTREGLQALLCRFPPRIDPGFPSRTDPGLMMV